MAKQDKDLFGALRDAGMRKKLARTLTDSASKANGKAPKALSESARKLRGAAARLEHRVGDTRRSDSAKKAARTRKRDAEKRSAAARKGARTRARLS